jgi:hypothetical protein
MNKFERRRFFEELCRLRALYRLRSEYDATSVIPVRDVVEYAASVWADGAVAATGGPVVRDAAARLADSR